MGERHLVDTMNLQTRQKVVKIGVFISSLDLYPLVFEMSTLCVSVPCSSFIPSHHHLTSLSIASLHRHLFCLVTLHLFNVSFTVCVCCLPAWKQFKEFTTFHDSQTISTQYKKNIYRQIYQNSTYNISAKLPSQSRSKRPWTLCLCRPAPELTDGRVYQWQLNDGTSWKDILNDHIIEAQYSLPHTKSMTIYNTIHG